MPAQHDHIDLISTTIEEIVQESSADQLSEQMQGLIRARLKHVLETAAQQACLKQQNNKEAAQTETINITLAACKREILEEISSRLSQIIMAKVA